MHTASTFHSVACSCARFARNVRLSQVAGAVRPLTSVRASYGAVTGLSAPRCPHTKKGLLFPVSAVQLSGAASRAMASAAKDEKYDFDLFTIGGGTGGVRAARFAASDYGARVALCELPFSLIQTETEGGLGGTCILRGCVPKKFLVYGGEYANDFKECEGYGWHIEGEITHDWRKLADRKAKQLRKLSDSYKGQLDKAGVHYIEGRATVKDEHTVHINGKDYTAKNILIATGGRAVVPPIEGKEHTIISDQILDLPKKPSKLVIVGGGYIAAEQACIYRNFGADVHMFFRGKHMLAGFDPEAAKHAEGQFKHKGINLNPDFSPVKVVKESDGKLTMTAKNNDDKEVTVDGIDYILMATGRKPATQGLGLDKIGVELDEKGGVKVDDFSHSNVASIWAIGDVTNRIPLTPVARMEGTYFAQHLFGGLDIKPDYANVASVVFSSPQVAQVGVNEDKAVEQYGDVDVFTSTFSALKDSLTDNEGKGFIKIVVDAKSDRVLGIHLVGPEVSEILQGFAAAMKAGITKTQLNETVGIHPTSAEELTTLRSVTRKYRNKEQVKD
ncbi:hypothetical protein ABBQ32_005016 [Trebouxia sp. C0010 RCD-2024]